MPKRSSIRKKPGPADVNQLAKSIVDQATGESAAEDLREVTEKNPAAVALGRLGGLKGGKSRASKLSKEQLTEIAKKAAAARWSRKPNS